MQTVTQPEQAKRPPAADEAFLHVRLPRELRRQVNIRAAQEDKSVASVVADALRKHLGMAA